MSFQCVVVTPDQAVLDETVSQVILPAHDGLVGILTDRSPLLLKLGTGPLRVDLAGGAKRFFKVSGGVAQMKDNKLTILSTHAKAAATEAEASAK